MDTVLAENIDFLMKEKGLNAYQLHAVANIPQSTTFRILNGETKSPSDRTVEKYAQYFGYSAKELRYSRIFTEDVVDINKSFEITDKMPVISWVQAGDWSLSEPVMDYDTAANCDWIPKPDYMSNKSFALEIKGNSMQPFFQEGDYVLVEPNVDESKLRDGDLIIAHCDDEGGATFKKIVINANGYDYYLAPLNSNWHTQEYRPHTECRLIGLVLGQYIDWRKKRV